MFMIVEKCDEERLNRTQIYSCWNLGLCSIAEVEIMMTSKPQIL